MRRRIFISGATGFTGLHLLHSLDKPENVLFGTSFPQSPPSLDLSCEHEITLVDICDKEQVLAAVGRARPDWIFHLAAVSSVPYSWQHQQETLQTNLLGTLNVFEAVREFVPQARVLFISSANIYAQKTGERVVLQETDPLEANNPYAFSKICGEQLSRFFMETQELDITIARTFNHTGPGQSPAFVCSDWARQVAAAERGGERVIRVGNIEVKRDFCDVRDVVKAYILLLEKGNKGEAYNISSDRAISLQEVLAVLHSLTSSVVEVQVDPAKFRAIDILSLHGDSRKVREHTGWKPEIPLKQTLRDLLGYWRRIL
jgi:GDP-4-dehydro-6-deoxy-D-mannose reductase